MIIEVTYLGGTLPDEDREALQDALSADFPRLSMTVTARPYNVVTMSATVRADNPLDAVTDVSTKLDRALIDTGLHDSFDATGRSMRVTPQERAAL